MTLTNIDKCPFPWFGGKSQAAPTVWKLMGDVDHYVEPFFGSGAVLLNRPHMANRPYVSETVNDADGFVVNFWRSVAWAPDAVADAVSWPVTELDKSARLLALQRWKSAGAYDRLAGDAAWHDPIMAGWWAWAICCSIGGWDGPWVADPNTGVITKQPRTSKREPGVTREKPHLSSAGQGVNNPGVREPGVTRTRPHLSDDGQGVNNPGVREPGVTRTKPHLGDDGRGVNHPGVREPGVLDPITASHGSSALDAIDWGATYHDQTMPEIIRWMRHLAARLRWVRVLCGDWTRSVTTGAAHTLSVRQDGHVGIFLDPPYSDTAERVAGLYVVDSLDVAHDVREWCLANGHDPRKRIVLAGFESEHRALVDAGWTEVEWFVDGWLRGGRGEQQHRERLWASPHCLRLDVDTQMGLFA